MTNPLIVSLYSADGVHQVQMSAPATMTANTQWVAPSDNGAAAGYLLQSDGLGNTSWVLPSNSNVSPTLIQYANVALSSAQILGMFASPVTIVPAPGAGKFLEFISGMLSVTFSGAAYTGGGNVSFNYAGQAAVAPVISAANSFGNAASQVWTVMPSANNGGASATFFNLGITLTNATGAFTQPGTAAGTARVAVAYRVHSLV